MNKLNLCPEGRRPSNSRRASARGRDCADNCPIRGISDIRCGVLLFLSYTPRFFQDLIERFGEMPSPRAVVDCSSIELALQHKIFVSNVESRQHRDAQGIHRRSLLRHQSHFGVNVVREPDDIFRIGSAKLVCLIVDFNTNTAVAVGLSQASLLLPHVARSAPLADAPVQQLLRRFVRRHRLNLPQHLFYSGSYLFALLAQGNQFGA